MFPSRQLLKLSTTNLSCPASRRSVVLQCVSVPFSTYSIISTLSSSPEWMSGEQGTKRLNSTEKIINIHGFMTLSTVIGNSTRFQKFALAICLPYSIVFKFGRNMWNKLALKHSFCFWSFDNWCSEFCALSKLHSAAVRHGLSKEPRHLANVDIPGVLQR